MKKILIGVVVVGLLGAAYGAYLYFKPNPSLKDLKTDETLTASALLSAFETDETAANASYLDKVIEVTGTIREVAQTDEGIATLTLNTDNDLAGVICEMEKDSKQRTFKEGETVTLKGMCTGMLMDVVLVRCVEK